MADSLAHLSCSNLFNAASNWPIGSNQNKFSEFFPVKISLIHYETAQRWAKTWGDDCKTIKDQTWKKHEKAWAHVFFSHSLPDLASQMSTDLRSDRQITPLLLCSIKAWEKREWSPQEKHWDEWSLLPTAVSHSALAPRSRRASRQFSVHANWASACVCVCREMQYRVPSYVEYILVSCHVSLLL